MIAIEQRKFHCGEVFVTNNNYRVMLQCKFCDKQLTAYDKFLNHIFDDHFDYIDDEDSTNDSLEFDDMAVLNAFEKNESNADNDSDITAEIIENTANIQTVENSQSLEMTITDVDQECDYAENEGSVCTEIAIITPVVDNQATNVAQQSKTPEESSVSSNVRTINNLNRQIIDGRERKFKCKFCDTAFGNVAILRNHEQRHSNNRPFCCTKCPKRFFSRTELNTHIRWHTGERPFVCTYCGNSYTTNGALNSHEKRHIGKRTYKCDHCDKSFYEGFHLRAHSVVHTKERKYTCEQCQAKFTRAKTLRMHMKLHENALRYKCSICNMRFNQKPTLIWHEKSKHAIVRGGAGASGEASNSTATKSADETRESDNEDTEYQRKCYDEFESNDSLSNHQEEHVAVDSIATLEAIHEADNEYVEFINI
uniref:Gastrula zinc finger protein XlCGF7.1 n=1 Tax=Zeugodacus cucurbitae TaxID=28588 RepID=A0A0A1WTK4_ZEUCU